MEKLGSFKSTIVCKDIILPHWRKRTNVMIQEHLKLSARNATVQER
jgi:hypothetical protein